MRRNWQLESIGTPTNFFVFYRSSTTSAPEPTSATGDVNIKYEPYLPDIPDLVAQKATEDTSKNYDDSKAYI